MLICRIGEGAAKRGIPTVVCKHFRHLGIAAVAVEYGFFGSSLREQRRNSVLVGLAVVNLQRQVQFLGEGDVLPKGTKLVFLTRLRGTEVVESRLANRHHFRIPSQVGHLCNGIF